MKALFVLAAVVGLTGLRSLWADEPASTRIHVIFDHPEKFTDVKDRSHPTEKGRQYILNQLRAFLVGEAERLLPDGDTLTLTFTDIDLAGDFEPSRGPSYDGIRVVKGIYPPAFKFSWKVTDSSGKVIKDGKESIRDLEFQTRPAVAPEDSLHYEKSVLNEWMRDHLDDLRR